MARGLGDYRVEPGETDYAAHVNGAFFWSSCQQAVFFGSEWRVCLPPMEYAIKPDDYLEVRYDTNGKPCAYAINQTGVVWIGRKPGTLR